MPSYLTEAFDELADGGLLAPAEQDPWGPRRISLTDTGTARYVQLNAPPRRAVLRVPDPQFPTKTSAGRRSSRPDDERVALLTDAAGSGLAVLVMSRRGTASLVEHAGLPVRSPGAHLHPLLRHPPVAGRCGARGRRG